MNRKCLRFYEKGRSLAEVSKLTGEPQSSIFAEMKRRGAARRPLAKMRKTNPPFGYAWLDGRLVIHPGEYKTVQLILDLSEAGLRPYHIEKVLNERRIPTRAGRRWFSRIITNVIRGEAERRRTGVQ